MLVEIFKAPFGPYGDGVCRLVAIQYSSSDSQMEAKMRAAHALFDVNIQGMSKEMISRMHRTTHRTAIFELKDPE